MRPPTGLNPPIPDKGPQPPLTRVPSTSKVQTEEQEEPHEIRAPLPHADGRVPSGLEPALRDTDPRRSWSPHPTCQRSNSRECETKGKLASTDNVSRGERRVDLHSPSQGIHLVIDVRDDQQTHFAEHPISRPPRRLGVGQFPPPALRRPCGSQEVGEPPPRTAQHGEMRGSRAEGGN